MGNREKYQKAIAILLQDVRQDLHQPRELLVKFFILRKNYPSQYTAAYIDLSLAQLLKPYITLDILSILHELYQNDYMVSITILSSFFDDNEVDFAIREWYQSVLEFCRLESLHALDETDKSQLLAVVCQIH